MESNFHTHTERCLHAYGKERDYAEYAADIKMKILGFSDHAPFPDKDYGLRMQFGELGDYIGEINRLKAEMQGSLTLYSGLEIEYIPKYIDYYKKLYDEYGLDYLILGEHMYASRHGSLRNIYFAETTEDYIDYARNVQEGTASGFFSMIAHPDLMFLNEFPWDKNCEKACDIILLAAEKYDLPLEFNINGVRKGKRMFPDGMRFPYPHEKFWRQLSGSKQKVMLGCDCHTPEQLNDSAVGESEKICRELRLNIINNLFEEEK